MPESMLLEILQKHSARAILESTHGRLSQSKSDRGSGDQRCLSPLNGKLAILPMLPASGTGWHKPCRAPDCPRTERAAGD